MAQKFDKELKIEEAVFHINDKYQFLSKEKKKELLNLVQKFCNEELNKLENGK